MNRQLFARTLAAILVAAPVTGCAPLVMVPLVAEPADGSTLRFAPDGLVPGQAVEIVMSGGERVEGMVVRWDDQSIDVEQAGGTRTLEFHRIQSLHIAAPQEVLVVAAAAVSFAALVLLGVHFVETRTLR